MTASSLVRGRAGGGGIDATDKTIEAQWLSVLLRLHIRISHGPSARRSKTAKDVPLPTSSRYMWPGTRRDRGNCPHVSPSFPSRSLHRGHASRLRGEIQLRHGQSCGGRGGYPPPARRHGACVRVQAAPRGHFSGCSGCIRIENIFLSGKGPLDSFVLISFTATHKRRNQTT